MDAVLRNYNTLGDDKRAKTMAKDPIWKRGADGFVGDQAQIICAYHGYHDELETVLYGDIWQG